MNETVDGVQRLHPQLLPVKTNHWTDDYINLNTDSKFVGFDKSGNVLVIDNNYEIVKCTVVKYGEKLLREMRE